MTAGVLVSRVVVTTMLLAVMDPRAAKVPGIESTLMVASSEPMLVADGVIRRLGVVLPMFMARNTGRLQRRVSRGQWLRHVIGCVLWSRCRAAARPLIIWLLGPLQIGIAASGVDVVDGIITAMLEVRVSMCDGRIQRFWWLLLGRSWSRA